jgi:hypothetical protein
MLRDEAVSLIALQLGNRTDLNTTIVQVMQLVQDTELEQTGVMLPWFLLSEDSTTTIAPGVRRVALPNDFILEDEDWGLGRENDNGDVVWLEKCDYDVLLQKFRECAGPLQAYSINGGYYYLFPVNNDAAEVLHMRYYAKAESVADSNIENAWLKHAPDALIAFTGYYLAARVLQNMELASIFQAAKQAAFVRLANLNEARLHTNHRYQMGEM